jgi:sugar transferase (PEP-CTERM system associated)
MIRIFRHYISRTYLVVFLVELCVFALAFCLGDLLRDFNRDLIFFISDGIWIPSLVFCVVMLLSFTGVGLYQRAHDIGDAAVMLRIIAGFLLGWAALTVLFLLIPQIFAWRRIIRYALVVSMAGILASRFLFFKYADQQLLKRRILVLGAGYRADTIRDFEGRSPQAAFRVVGFIRMGGEPVRVAEDRLLEAPASLLELAGSEDIDEIVVAPDDRRGGINIDDILDCKIAGYDVVDLLSFFEREAGLLRVDILNPGWLVFSDGFRLVGVAHVFKRGFDILASLALLAAAWPVMMLAGLAIAAESGLGAPLLYRQVRVGLHGRPFEVVKFRSMRTDAEKDGKAQWARPNDDRVTRVGRFLRKVRIDELPQLWNVLKGEMSFVGPRPERPEFVEKFAQTIPYYAERHRVKPGITGWAQLCYSYGSSYQDTIEKLQYDLYYVKNYSIFLDLLIILQTIEVVLWGKGL